MINFKKIKYKNLAPFYFKKIEDDYLLTNDFGGWLILAKEEFDIFLSNDFNRGGDLYAKLKEGNFLRGELNIDQLSKEYCSRNEFLFSGPSLHIIILTQRCNQKCVYCHASAKDVSKKEFDMNENTAQKIVDRIFEAPTTEIIIEFQGGSRCLIGRY